MRVVFLFALFFSSSFSSELSVKITNIKNDVGVVRIGLFDSAKDFPTQERACMGAVLKIKNHQASYTFKNVISKKYALGVFHDENKNNVLDKNFFGVPKEGYAFSNGAKGSFGPPSFEDASFILTQDKTITIKLGY